MPGAERLPAVVLLMIGCATAQHVQGVRPKCPDARLREAAIGGDAVTGVVILRKKPLQSAIVRFYDSSGKTAWIGATDSKGEFKTSQLLSGKFRVEISRWGSTTVELSPQLDQEFAPQVPAWRVFFEDNACVSWAMTLN